MESVVFGCGSFLISYRIFGWLGLVGELIGFVIFLERVYYGLPYLSVFFPLFFFLLFFLSLLFLT